MGPLTFLYEGAQYDRMAPIFEKCRPIFELKVPVTPYFQSFNLTTTITNLLLNGIQTIEAHKINQTLAVADTSVSSDHVSSI